MTHNLVLEMTFMLIEITNYCNFLIFSILFEESYSCQGIYTYLHRWAVHGVLTGFDSVGSTAPRLVCAGVPPAPLHRAQVNFGLSKQGLGWNCLSPTQGTSCSWRAQMCHCDDRNIDAKPNCGWMRRFGEMITWKITFFLCLTILHLKSGETVARILRLFPHKNGLQRYFFC